MNRRYDFDWLRAFGAVLVVVAHSTMPYAPWFANVFARYGYPALPSNRLFGALDWNLNIWLMPLFMLLAGSSAWYALARRPDGRYLRERLLHLGLPLLILMVAFVIPAVYISRAASGLVTGSLLEFYPRFFESLFPEGNFTFMHLWFLVYLLIYSVVTLPLFRYLRSPDGCRLIDRLARICGYTGGLYVFALPLLAVQLALSGLEPAVLTQALVNDWTRFFSLLLVFVFGYMLIADARFQAAIARQWTLALALALATSAAMGAFAWPDSFNPLVDIPNDYSWRYAAYCTLVVLATWSWMIAWLGIGQRFLNVDHPLRQHAAGASYPLYLLHYIPLMLASVALRDWKVDALTGAGTLLVVTLVSTLALAAVLRRWRATRLLLGLKPEPAAPQATGLRVGALSVAR